MNYCQMKRKGNCMILYLIISNKIHNKILINRQLINNKNKQNKIFLMSLMIFFFQKL